MPKNIAADEWPRLTGEFCSGPRHSWRLSRDDNSLEITPAGTPWALIGFLLFLSVMGGLAIPVVFKYAASNVSPLLAIGMGILLAISVAFVALLIRAYSALEQNRGPILRVDLTDKRISFPREGISYAFERILSCDVVVGTHIRGTDGRPLLFDETSELQFVIMEDDGIARAKPVVGGGGKYDTVMYAAATEIAEALDVRCNRVDDKQA